MSDDVITIDNVSKELLKSVLDAALMETSLDSDGDIIVKEQCRCYVLLDKDKRRIMLLTQFGFKPSASEGDKLVCANKINRDYIIVRAVVGEKSMRFTYDLSLDGGITRKALALLVKRFCSIPYAALSDYGKDLVE
jgi:hypothetical protein